jgi:hypothetical protein
MEAYAASNALLQATIRGDADAVAAVNYDKDTKEHTCVIEEWEKE